MSRASDIQIKRGQAGKLIDDIREVLAESKDPAASIIRIERLMKVASITPLTPCDGDAHSNPHIDNCSQCMPRWGLVGGEVKVR